MLEHLVFKGTQNRSAKEIASALESLGGSLDAYTAREHTCFQARVLDEHLDEAADVLADIVFRPALRSDDLNLERKVVLEEIAMVEDSPDDIVFELHNEALWGGASVRLLDPRHARVRREPCSVDAVRALHAAGLSPVADRRGGERQHRARRPCSPRCERTGWHDIARGDDTRLSRAAARGGAGARPAHRARFAADAPRVRFVDRLARGSAPLSADADRHAARRRHELAAVPAHSRGTRPRVLGLHVPELPRARGHARRVRRHRARDRGAGDRRGA